MPREERRFYCDICGQFYLKREMAVECEQSHLIPKSVDKPQYCKNDNKNEYPDSVLIHFERNGKQFSARYYRSNERR